MEEESDVVMEQDIFPGCFAIVKVYSSDGKFKKFVGLLQNGPDDDGDFKVKFMKRSNKIKNGFVFPEIEDLASAKKEEIVFILPKPTAVASTKSLSGVLRFDVNLSRFGV